MVIASLEHLIGVILCLHFFRTFQNILELFPVPEYGFRWSLIGLAAINAVLCIFLEDVVMENGVQNLWKKYGPTAKTKYNEIEAWINRHPEWPTLSMPQVGTRTFFLIFNLIEKVTTL